ncbi:hypothetical protein [Flammeovirga sp. SJP92]|uniref:hypothetical protein n=1 Tax=Flammeovirga sp. SJP92 TaxID=1775430 RepID=UPI0007894350|nr:hypothetical protein [Flammeovirga sp. SJP92]KXX69283.1 hypothetical protein AVL50_19895 [Flammeovirga sp. SJP92]
MPTNTQNQTNFDIIKQLNYHQENNQVFFNEHDGGNEKEFAFVKQVFHFANQNPEVIKDYCRTNTLSYFASNQWVYSAVTSKEGSQWHTFIFEEIKRVVGLVNNQDVELDALSQLWGISTLEIYYDNHDLYNEIMEFMTVHLDLRKGEDYNVLFLKLMDFLVRGHDENEFKDFSRSERWLKRLVFFANKSPLKIKLQAREVLETVGYQYGVASLSLMENLKKCFI